MKVNFNLDIDDKIMATALQDFLLAFKVRHEAMERASSSGRGSHFKIETSVPKYFLKELDKKSFILGMRYALGDCLGRIKMDMSRDALGLDTDRLFISKNGSDAGKWKKVK